MPVYPFLSYSHGLVKLFRGHSILSTELMPVYPILNYLEDVHPILSNELIPVYYYNAVLYVYYTCEKSTQHTCKLFNCDIIVQGWLCNPVYVYRAQRKHLFSVARTVFVSMPTSYQTKEAACSFRFITMLVRYCTRLMDFLRRTKTPYRKRW